MFLKARTSFALPKTSHLLLTLVSLALISLGIASYKLQPFTKAANPAFSLNQSGSYIVGDSRTLTLTVNGTSEGSGLLGAETHITYDASKVQVTGINFGSCAFDSCLDFSESGTLKLIGVSGPGGKSVSNSQTLATLTLNLLESGTVPFSFTKSNVITGAQVVESRMATATSLAILTEEGALCGNAVLQTGEQCDDGNLINGDGCSSSCTTEVPPACGNSILEGGEACDDGNTASGDGCSATCTVEFIATCGNSIPEGSEACDDGNTASGDGCSAVCQNEIPVTKTLDSINISIGSGYSSTVTVGAFTQLNTFAYYSDSSSSNITSPPPVVYTSSNASIASMSGSKVYGHVPGSVTITASYTEGGVTRTDTQSIIVSAAPEPVPEPEPEPTPEPEPVPEPEPAPEESVPLTLFPTPTPNPDALTGTTAEELLRPAALETIPVQTPQETLLAPATQEEIRVAVEACKLNIAYAGANFDDLAADVDQDGLSNRMECYAKTNPVKYDTDDDGCSDGDEVLQLFGNPLDANDCPSDVIIDKTITITDPQTDWIISTVTPRLSGIAPANTAKVKVILLEANQIYINSFLEALKDLSSPNLADDKKSELLKNLEKVLTQSNDFLGTFATDYDYDAFETALISLQEILKAYQDPQQQTKPSLDTLLASFQGLLKPPVNAENEATLQDTLFGNNKLAKNFQLIAPPLNDKAIYLAVAEATLADGTTIVSPAVRFTVDTAFSISAPLPKELGGETVILDPNSPELFIQELRPTVNGDSEFNSQVFAVWNSLVLSSSVISDSEAGSFAIQAPKNLEDDTSHKVTLYAVKVEGERKIRSENAEVLFRISAPVFNIKTALYGLLFLLLLMLLAYLIRRALLKEKVPPSEIPAASNIPVSAATPPIPTPSAPQPAAPHITEPALPYEGIASTEAELLGHTPYSAAASAKTYEDAALEARLSQEAEDAEMKAIQEEAHQKRQKHY